VPPLISTIKKSPQHPLSFFQPAVSSAAVHLQQFLTVEILQLHALKYTLLRLQNRTDLVAPVPFKITPRHGPRSNTPFPTVLLLLCVDFCCGNVFTETLPRNSHCISTDLRWLHSNGSTRYIVEFCIRYFFCLPLPRFSPSLTWRLSRNFRHHEIVPRNTIIASPLQTFLPGQFHGTVRDTNCCTYRII
jgi:hypothetical protein